MQPIILITDGGAHPPAKWAEATAAQIVAIGKDASGDQAAAGRRLELRILDILEAHYQGLQDGERGKLAAEGDNRLDAPLGGHALCGPVVDEIVAAAAGTPFEAHFARDEVKEHIHRVLHDHADNALAIERSWHADRHPDGPKARAFRARHRDGVSRRPKGTA